MVKNIFFLCFVALNNFAFAQNKDIDSIELLVHLESFDLNTVASILEFEKGVLNANLSDSLNINLIEKALRAAQHIDKDTLAARYARLLSKKYTYSTVRNSSLVLEYAELALKHAQESGVEEAILSSQLVLGHYYYNSFQFPQAIEYYLIALDNFNDSEDYTSLANLYLSLGNCYWQLGDIDNSVKYANQSIFNSKKAASPDKELGLAYGNISLYSHYKQIDQIDSVEYFLNNAIQYAEQLKDINNQGQYDYIIHDIYLSASLFYISQDKREMAKYFFDSPLLQVYFPEYHYVLSIDFAVRENNLKIATRLVEDMPPMILKEYKNKYDWSKYIYSVLASYYEKIEDTDNYLMYYKKLNDIEVNRTKADNVKMTTYAEAKMEIIQQKDKVALLEKTEILNSTRRNWLITAVLLMASLLGLALYLIFQMRSKNKLLQENLKGQQIIKEQAQQLMLINQQRSMLFVNIAHELQTPLHLIEGLAKQVTKSLEDNSLPKEQMQIIIKNSHELFSATEQILNLSKAEEKILQVYPDLFYLKDLVNYVIPEFQMLIDSKNINLAILPKGDLEALVYTDINKLKTILKNLLSNAIKYTPKNGNITIEYGNPNEGVIAITVKDDGRGIAENDISKVFTRYYQSVKLKPEGGVGIGLAICQVYSTLLKGEISVSSTLGVGSTFLLKMPQFFEKPQKEQEIYSFPIIEAENTENVFFSPNQVLNKSILIVEDNLDFCKYLKIILHQDYNLSIVHNGQEALLDLEKNTHDLIITDWMMPEIDGLELVKHLKEHEVYQHIPVMMLTARNVLSDKIKALRVGVDDYMLKQFEEEHLKSRLIDLLQRSNSKYAENVNLNPTDTEQVEFSEKEDETDSISFKSQNWLIELEELIFPQIGNFNLKSDTIAEEMKLSTKQLNRRIKLLTGLTSMKYIQELRFWEARRMLETKAYDSVKAVALSVGYKDQQNFSKKFKERFGKNPIDFLDN